MEFNVFQLNIGKNNWKIGRVKTNKNKYRLLGVGIKSFSDKKESDYPMDYFP